MKVNEPCKKGVTKIRTDVLSIKKNLLEAIEIPPEVTPGNCGVRKNKNPMKGLNRITLERADQLARMNEPEAPCLKYALRILKVSKEVQKQMEDSEAESEDLKEWSVFSELCSSEESDSEDDFTSRLQEVEQGHKLRRRSTLVSDFGFKHRKISIDSRGKMSKLEPIHEQTATTIQQNSKKVNLLKTKQKRKIDKANLSKEAFCFLNQLGRKLLVKQQMYMKHHIKGVFKDHTSLENHKIGSESSDISSNSVEKDYDINVMMSPIKTRKQIKSPTLDKRQENILNLWTVYKAGDLMSVSNASDQKQRNNSQTPMDNHKLMNKTSGGENEECNSCTKVSVMKLKRKKKGKKLKSKSSKQRQSRKGKKKAPKFDLSKNMIVLNNLNVHQENGSPTNHMKKTHSFNSGKRIGKMSMYVDMKVLEGLNDIINDMESNPTLASSSNRMDDGRRFSCNVVSLPTSPSKPRKKKAKRKATRKKSGAVPVQSKLKTTFDLSKIVEGLGEVLEEEDISETITPANNTRKTSTTTKSKRGSQFDNFNQGVYQMSTQEDLR